MGAKKMGVITILGLLMTMVVEIMGQKTMVQIKTTRTILRVTIQTKKLVQTRAQKMEAMKIKMGSRQMINNQRMISRKNQKTLKMIKMKKEA
jgi:hypothetical protein